MNRPSRSTGLVVAVVVICALVVCLAAVSALTVGVAVAQDGDEQNTSNETTEHENPDTVGEDGDADRTADWLAGELARSLEGSTVSISEGEYEAARSVVGDDYDDRVEQFVEVAGETSSPEETESEAGEYQEIADDQEELATLFEEFNETLEEYEAAREEGDTERARESARELIELADEIESLGGEVSVQFDRLSERESVDLTQESASIRNGTNETRVVVDEVATEQFTETEITVLSIDQRGSFVDPVEIELQVTTVDGEPIGNEPVEIAVGDDTPIETETNAFGVATVAYRPVTAAVGTANRSIAYQPDRGSQYLNAETNATVTIEQVNASVSIEEAPEQVAFGESINVTATGSVENATETPTGLVLEGAVGSVDLGTASIEEGVASFNESLPADIPPGSYEIAVASENNSHAVNATGGQSSIEIVETETALSVQGLHNAETGTLQVSGTLKTDDGEPIAAAPVAIALDNETIETVETDEEGRIAHSIEVENASAYAVSAEYDEGGSNLAPARAETTVTGVAPGNEQTVPWGAIGVGGLLVLGGAAVVWWVRRSEESQTDDETGSPDRENTGAEGGRPDPTAGLSAAAALADGDPERAIRTAYGTVRTALGRDGAIETQGLTHWELYDAYQSNGSDAARSDALKTVTTLFEQAAFAPQHPNVEDATTAIEAARRVLDRSS